MEVVLPKADLYVMAKIVHDWNPQQIASLLSKVYASLNEGEVVYLADCLGIILTYVSLLETGGLVGHSLWIYFSRSC